LTSKIKHANKSKNKKHIIISLEAEKAFGKILHPFRIKTPKKLGIECSFPNIKKATYDRPVTNIMEKA
jgi:hypothetical protein